MSCPRVCLVLALALTAGCAGTIESARRIERASDAENCVRLAPEARITASPDIDPDTVVALPPEVRRAAAAAAITNADPGERVPRLERLMLLTVELAATRGEVECLSDHVEELESELEDRRRSWELAFTISSVALAAGFAIAAGILALTTHEDADAWTQIVGGIGVATLGTIAFFPPDETVVLVHERNVLRAIWGDEETTLPRFVARLFQLPRHGEASPRERLRLDWADMTASSPESRELLLGNGGTYRLADLRRREVMLEAIELEIHLQSQELELLLRGLADVAGE